MSEPHQRPTKVALHLKSNQLELEYPQGGFLLSAEYLRVNSPSAEVRGHGKPVLQVGKREVKLVGIEPSGNFAVKLIFDDGHDTGLYSWDLLHQLCIDQSSIWQNYLDQLEQAGASREPQPGEPVAPKTGGCGSGRCGG